METFRAAVPTPGARRRWPGTSGWVPVAGAAVFAVAVALRATARYGPGAEPDTVTYLAAAHHLGTGHGFADIDGSPLTLFPPLFPAAVAALEWLGLGPLPAARFLNAALLGVLVVLAAVWTRRISGSAALGAAVAVVVAVASPMVAMGSDALSEPIGIVFVVACLLFLTEARRTGAVRHGLLAGLAAALACLARYASVALFPVGIVVLLLRPGRATGRIRLAATFLVAGAVPFGAWLARNVAVAGNPTGDGRGRSALTFATSLKLTLAAVGAWVLPGGAPAAARAVVGGGLVATVTGALLALTVAERRRDRPAEGSVPGPVGGPGGGRALGAAGLALPAAVFVAFGVGSVVWFEATMAIDPPPRFLLPVYVPLVVAAAVGVAGLARHRAWRPPAAVALVALVVAASLPGLEAFVRRADRKGLLDYSTPAWAASPLLASLKADPVRGMVASDDPYVLELRLGIPAALTPARTYYASRQATGELPTFVQQATRAAAAGGLSVVWFPRSYQPYLYSLADLEKVLCLTVERHFADGDLLRSCPAGT
jgi:4-amino-4-deoxy-L-arabinose transferase-like glycosyltransferase